MIDSREESLEYFWYALYVKPRHEFKVLDRLTRAGIETFLPCIDRLRRWKDRKKLITFPLFPGYIFIHIRRIPSDIIKVLRTDGVIRFIGFEPRNPERVPDEQIYSLKKIMESGEGIDPYPYLREGRKVIIKRGPLTGAEGILIKKKDTHLFVVSIDILRRSVSVKIDASDIEAIE